MNKVIMIGSLTRDSEMSYSKNEKAIVKFSIAINEGYGENKTVQFFNVTSFGAEKICPYLVKGTKVAILGKVQNSNYEKDGVKIYKTEIIADNFGGIEFVGGKKEEGIQDNKNSFGGANFEEEMTPVNDSSMPF